MPRRSIQVSSALQQVQKQARELVAALRNEIRSKEMGLRQLKDEESQLARLAGQGGGARVSTNGAIRKSGGRVNWGMVLEQMPKQFRAVDVGKVRSVKGKRSSEIFAGISRWVEAGAVKRKERGLYERVK
jgi:hypothetical protein